MAFLQARYSLTFLEAAADLTRRYGIPHGNESAQVRPIKTTNPQALELADRLEGVRQARLDRLKHELWEQYDLCNKAWRWLQAHPEADWDSLRLQGALTIQSRSEIRIIEREAAREQIEQAGARELLTLMRRWHESIGRVSG